MQYITQSCRAFRPKGDLHDTTFTLPEFLKSRNGLVAEAIGKRTRKKTARLPMAPHWAQPKRSTWMRALVELTGIEPVTPCLQSRCSPS